MTSVIRSANADKLLRSALKINKFFQNGWGNIDILQRLQDFQKVVVDKDRMLRNVYGILEDANIVLCNEKQMDDNQSVCKGEFISPLTTIIPGALPKESEIARFELVLPKNSNGHKPLCIHLAGTGDHFFWRRRHFMASPLAKEHGIASIILENPFYGSRKPKSQIRSSVNHVSDIFVMGAALLVECVALMLWCERQGFGPLGITGISMGGHMATVASSGWYKPMAIVPCLSWSSAAPVFTEGVMSRTIAWDVLEKQLSTSPQYQDLLKCDHDYHALLRRHYNSSFLSKAQNGQPNRSANEAPADPGYSQVYSRFTSALSNVSFPWAFDIKGKKIGPIAIEFDFLKQLQTLPKQVWDTLYGRISFDVLKDLPFIPETTKEPCEETVIYMSAIMDRATHLSNFLRPHEKSAIIYTVADHDQYIPIERYQITPRDIWPQTQVRRLDCGHIMGILQHQSDFRNSIKDAFLQLSCS